MLCVYKGCDKVSVSKGYCDTHRKRIARRGNVESGRPEWWGKRDYVFIDGKKKRVRKETPEQKIIRRNRDGARKYKMTPEEYDKLLNTECKICGTKSNLVVDHCHKSGRVRGILCSVHNRMLGLTYDSIQILESAIRYLREHS